MVASVSGAPVGLDVRDEGGYYGYCPGVSTLLLPSVRGIL